MRRSAMIMMMGALGAGGVFAAAAPASTGERAHAARTTPGVVLGGQTSQRWPVVVELNKAGTQVVRISAGLHLTCTSGGVVNLPDAYGKLKLSKSGKFSSSFGPDKQQNDNGTTTEFTGSITGTVNKARTKASGKWQFQGVDHDASGAVTDTCTSGGVTWSVKQ